MPRPAKTAAEKAALASALAAETKAEKFARLAKPRYEAAVLKIRSLGKLGASAYERDPVKVQALAKVLHSEVDAMLERLMPRERSGRTVENLPDVL